MDNEDRSLLTARAIAAAGGKAALAKRLASMGVATTRHSISRWEKGGGFSEAAGDALEKIAGPYKPAPKKRVKKTSLDKLYEKVGTWKKVAAVIGVSEGRLRKIRSKGSDEVEAKAAEALRTVETPRQTEARHRRTLAGVLSKIARDLAPHGQARLAVYFNVDEATIRRWLKSGPPLSRLSDYDIGKLQGLIKQEIVQAESAWEAFGKLLSNPGRRALAAFLKVKVGTLQRWWLTEKLPASRHLQIVEAAAAFLSAIDGETMMKLIEESQRGVKQGRKGVVTKGYFERIVERENAPYLNKHITGWSNSTLFGEILTEEFIWVEVEHYIARVKKRLPTREARWQIVAWVTIMAFDDRTQVFVKQTSKAIKGPGGTVAKVGLDESPQTVVLTLGMDKHLKAAAMKQGLEVEAVRNRFRGEHVISSTNTSFDKCREEFLEGLRDAMSLGVCFIRGMAVNHFTTIAGEPGLKT